MMRAVQLPRVRSDRYALGLLAVRDSDGTSWTLHAPNCPKPHTVSAAWLLAVAQAHRSDQRKGGVVIALHRKRDLDGKAYAAAEKKIRQVIFGTTNGKVLAASGNDAHEDVISEVWMKLAKRLDRIERHAGKPADELTQLDAEPIEDLEKYVAKCTQFAIVDALNVNTLDRATKKIIRGDDLNDAEARAWMKAEGASAGGAKVQRDQRQRWAVRKALESTGGDYTEAAARLGVSRRTLERWTEGERFEFLPRKQRGGARPGAGRKSKRQQPPLMDCRREDSDHNQGDEFKATILLAYGWGGEEACEHSTLTPFESSPSIAGAMSEPSPAASKDSLFAEQASIASTVRSIDSSSRRRVRIADETREAPRLRVVSFEDDHAFNRPDAASPPFVARRAARLGTG